MLFCTECWKDVHGLETRKDHKYKDVTELVATAKAKVEEERESKKAKRKGKNLFSTLKSSSDLY